MSSDRNPGTGIDGAVSRFWLTRGSHPDLSDHGFLVDPECLRPVLARAADPLEKLVAFPALALLGEPGMGKTNALSVEARRIKALCLEHGSRVLLVDLTAYGSDVSVSRAIFQAPEFQSWINSESTLYLLLDGFDTCLNYVPSLVSLLLDQFARVPRERLRLRITCRSGEWPEDMEDGLRGLWQGISAKSLAVYELAPLRRLDIKAIAERARIPPQPFLQAVDKAGAAQFANRPLTLAFLLDSFEKTGALPSRMVDLYREGCLVLSEEAHRDRRRLKRPRKLSAGLRFAVAGRMAAVHVFSSRVAIWTAPRGKMMPEGDVRLDDLVGGEERFEREVLQQVNDDDIRETIAAGLFQAVGPERMGFSHQTFAEYLAAQYVTDRLPVPEILKLIFNANGSGKIVPQLREVAAWLGSLTPEVLQHVLTNDPEALFRSSVANCDLAVRRTLIQSVLRLYDERKLFDERIGSAVGGRLDYPELDLDLRPYIRDKSKGLIVRRAAINLAVACVRCALEEDLLQVAIDDTEIHTVRLSAVFALSHIGSSLANARLSGLSTGASIDDPDDEIKGGALSATWPKDLTAQKLFASLTAPKLPKLSGAYKRFLRNGLVPQIQPEDMCIALDWARQNPNGDGGILSQVSADIVRRAVAYTDVPGVLERLADALPERAMQFGVDWDLKTKLRLDQPARQRIAHIALATGKDGVTLRWCGLVLTEDLPWLLSDLATASAETQKAIARVIVMLFDPNDADTFTKIWETAQVNSTLHRELQPYLAPVAIGSAEAMRSKLRYEVGLPQTPQDLHRDPEPKLDELISGSSPLRPRMFFEICSRLYASRDAFLEPGKEGCLPRWHRLSGYAHERVLESAELYLNEWAPEVRNWIKTGDIPRDALFGCWALRLLHAESRSVFDSLPDALWRKWCGCVVGYPLVEFSDHGWYSEILQTVWNRVPTEFLKALEELVVGENLQPGQIMYPDRFSKVWNVDIASMLRSSLGDDKLQSVAVTTFLDTLLRHKDEGAHAFAIDLARRLATGDYGERNVAAACQLLLHDPEAGWEIVWPLIQRGDVLGQKTLEAMGQAGRELIFCNPESGWTRIWPAIQSHTGLAQEFFTGFPWVDSKGPDEPDSLLEKLGERELGEMYCWLTTAHCDPLGDQHGGLIVPERTLTFARDGIIMHLAKVGTPMACSEVRRLQERFGGDALSWHLKDAEELLDRKSWRPPTPKIFMDTIGAARAPALPVPRGYAVQGSDDQPAKSLTAPEAQSHVASDIPRHQPAKKSADLKTSKKRLTLLAELRAELKTVQRAKNGYITIEKLKRKHPTFKLWKMLAVDEQKELISDDFIVGHYSAQIVAKEYGIEPRTLKYDRKKLRSAGQDIP